MLQEDLEICDVCVLWLLCTSASQVVMHLVGWNRSTCETDTVSVVHGGEEN